MRSNDGCIQAKAISGLYEETGNRSLDEKPNRPVSGRVDNGCLEEKVNNGSLEKKADNGGIRGEVMAGLEGV